VNGNSYFRGNTSFAGNISASGNVGIGKTTATATATLDVSGNFNVNNGRIGLGISAPARDFHGVGEFSWTPGTANANTAYFNIHDTTANNGGNYTVAWRGLGTNGGVQVNLTSFDVYSNRLFVNGPITAFQPYYFAKRYQYGGLRIGVVEHSRDVNTNVASYYISSSGNGYFKPLLKGVYYVIANDIGATGAGQLYIRKNGTAVNSSHWNHTDTWENIMIMAHVSCNGSTDTIDIYADSPGVYGDGSGAYGSLAIHYVSTY
jgi:hypothetical protein